MTREMLMPDRITKAEREELHRIVRQREKVMKSAAKQRSAELLADFEDQMNADYQPEDDPVWEEVTKAAEAEVEKAQKKIKARCRELGISDKFAPRLSVSWHHRGYYNTLEKQRTELRVVAKARIEAIERDALHRSTSRPLRRRRSSSPRGSRATRRTLSSPVCASVESLMPGLSFREMAGISDVPIAEQLVSNNAERQRRFRERRKQANAVRLQLHALAYNLANFFRTLVLPDEVERWSLTTLREKVVKIGAKVIAHARYTVFQMAEVAVSRDLFRRVLDLIDGLRPRRIARC